MRSVLLTRQNSGIVLKHKNMIVNSGVEFGLNDTYWYSDLWAVPSWPTKRRHL